MADAENGHGNRYKKIQMKHSQGSMSAPKAINPNLGKKNGLSQFYFKKEIKRIFQKPKFAFGS